MYKYIQIYKCNYDFYKNQIMILLVVLKVDTETLLRI